MSDAGIPRPSICRKVILSRKDRQPFPIGAKDQMCMFVVAMPADVVGVERDEDYAILCMVGERWFRAPHRAMAPESYPGSELVWEWPPLRLEGIQSKT